MADDYLWSAIGASVSKGITDIATPYFTSKYKTQQEKEILQEKERLKQETLGKFPKAIAVENPDGTISYVNASKYVADKPEEAPSTIPTLDGLTLTGPEADAARLKFPGDVSSKTKPEQETLEERLARIEQESAARARGASGVKVGDEPLPSGETGKIALSNQAISYLDKSKKILFPNGTADSFKREIATEAKTPAPLTEEAQDLKRYLRQAIKGQVLIETGVAASPGEVEQKLDSFVAGITTNPKSFIKALDEMMAFYNDYLSIVKTRGREFKKEDGKKIKTPILPPVNPNQSTGTVMFPNDPEKQKRYELYKAQKGLK